jgi:hypothetical protein
MTRETEGVNREIREKKDSNQFFSHSRVLLPISVYQR